MRNIFILLTVATILFSESSLAQLPTCSSNTPTIIYIQQGSNIFNYDVTLPISATNPILNTIPSGGSGLAISQNLNNPSGPSPTFYAVSGGNYVYWDGVAWVNTGHNAGPGGFVNPGGGGNYIYNYSFGGDVTRYDGTGNATILFNIPGFGSGGPFDIVGDCDGGFYVIRTQTTGGPSFVRKYDSAANLVQSWTTTGTGGNAGGGFAIVNNTIYFYNGTGFHNAPFSTGLSNLSFTPNTDSIPNPSDMASCPVCDITPPPGADFGISNDTICESECIMFNDLSTDTPTVWSWTFPGGTPSSSSVQNPPQVCFNTPGVHSIRLIVGNSVGMDTVVKVVNVFAQPTASITGESSICDGESATLLVQPSGQTYAWNTNESTQSISVTPNATTTYTAIVSNPACADTTTFVVEVNEPPIVAVSSTRTDCDKDNGTATAAAGQGTPPYTFDWGGMTGATITDLPVGNYNVVVTDAKGCTTSASVSVGIHPNPVATITPYPEVSVRIGESVQLNATGGVEYTWTPDIYLSCTSCPNPVVRTPISEFQLYCVKVTDENGCEDTACTTVVVDTSCSTIFIPNAFTPNGDTRNDNIKIENSCDINQLTFRIFNRWGQLVFETDRLNDPWDGTFKGELQPIGTFYYFLNADLINGRKVIQRGDITLIR